MNDHLNIALALAKQEYEEVTGLTSLDALERNEFGSGPKRERIEELLKRLNGRIESVQRTLSEQVSESSGAPILSVPSSHRTFYNDVVVPHGKLLQRAYYEISGNSLLGELALLDDATVEKPRPRMFEAMSFALERWDNMLDEDESFDWYDRGFNIHGAQEIVGMPWFQPDEWSQNLSVLHPVLVDRTTQAMRDHVRYRLTEIYRAFTFGLWMAAIALSRSLVEFSIKANAPRLGISATFIGEGGRKEDKSLKALGRDVASVLPSLEGSLETVRDTGNRILHPKKHDVIAHPKVMRAEALDCIRAARVIVETLYSEIPPAK
jgi:hypothetical protein